MQTVTVNQTKTLRVSNETLNGLNISCMLESAAVNTAVPITDYTTIVGFDPSEVNVEVVLSRNGRRIQILNANLGVLAHFMTIKKNGHLWRKGVTLQDKSVGTTQLVTRNLFVYFGGHLNLRGSDELIVTLQLNRAAFGSGIDTANSNISIETNQSIGVEYAVHKLNVYSIDANQQSDNVVMGDNITRVAMISFEKDWTKTIFRSATLSSDRLDWQANEQSLITRHFDKFDYNNNDMLLDALADNVHPMVYPNSFLVHDKDEIDRAKLQFTMNAPNVQASKNFIVFQSFETDREIIAKAIQMREKHEEKNIEKIPLSS